MLYTRCSRHEKGKREGIEGGRRGPNQPLSTRQDARVRVCGGSVYSCSIYLVMAIGSNECSLGKTGELAVFFFFFRHNDITTGTQSGFHLPCSARRRGTGYPVKLTCFFFRLCERVAQTMGRGRVRDLERVRPGRFSIGRARRRRKRPRGRGARTCRLAKKTRFYLGGTYRLYTL